VESIDEIKVLIERAFDRLRAELFEVEFEMLVNEGFDGKLLGSLLAKYSAPIGLFYMLSALRRSRMNLNDFIKSNDFLFKRHAFICNLINREVKVGGRVLEIGCGRGLNVCALALEGYDVYGVDVSAEALNIAEKLAEKLGCRVQLKPINGVRLPFESEFFDAVLYAWSIHEFDEENIELSLREATRVLKRSGFIYIIDQEKIAPFDLIDDIASSLKLKLIFEEVVSPVYDHGICSRAILRKYVKLV